VYTLRKMFENILPGERLPDIIVRLRPEFEGRINPAERYAPEALVLIYTQCLEDAGEHELALITSQALATQIMNAERRNKAVLHEALGMQQRTLLQLNRPDDAAFVGGVRRQMNRR